MTQFRSRKFKVNRPINAVTEHQPYLWNGNAYENLVHGWSTMTRIIDMRGCDLKGHGYNATSSVRNCPWFDKQVTDFVTRCHLAKK